MRSKCGEDVELRQRERGEAVHPRGVAQRDEVEPAAAALASGRRPVLAAELAHPLLVGALDLGRERALADARHVGLRDADDLVDPRRPDADARGRGGRDRVGRGDERIGAVVEVEQRPLRALEQDALPLAQGACRRGATCRRRTARRRCAYALEPLGALLELERLARRRRARARRSSRRARSRSSGAGSSGRGGPARGFRAATPCRRRPGRSRAASCRSGAGRAAARSRRRSRRATA